MTKNLRFGIVGAGSRGVHAFGKMIGARSDADVVALCDTNRLRMELAAEILQIKPEFYASVPEMVKGAKLDAVVITTPDFFHEQNAVEALNAGVHVLIDKPLATTVKGCKHIISVAEKTSLTVMIGFNLRHNAVLKKLKQIITDGMLGRVFLLENREFYNGGRTYMARWNRDYAFCGGLWIHKGSHDFDIFQWLLDFPKPVKVSSFADISVLNMDNLPFAPEAGTPVGPTCHACAYKTRCPDFNDLGNEIDRWGDEAAKLDGYHKDLCIYASDKSVHDNGFAMVEYDNGARASHMECFVTPVTDRRYTIVGTGGQAEASLHDATITVLPRWTKDTVTYKIAPETGGHGGADPHVLDTFIQVVRGEIANTSTTHHGMMSTAVGQAAELARRENRVVMIDELLKH
jgi:predicted dehydrogenase